jgi:hypothetical protein
LPGQNPTLITSCEYASLVGYTGTDYADYQNASNDYVQWTVNVGKAGTYTLAFRYANGGAGNRPLAIAVNGTTINGSLAFPATANWSTWNTVSLMATLNAGNNTVRATATGQSGGNIDYLSVTG